MMENVMLIGYVPTRGFDLKVLIVPIAVGRP